MVSGKPRSAAGSGSQDRPTGAAAAAVDQEGPTGTSGLPRTSTAGLAEGSTVVTSLPALSAPLHEGATAVAPLPRIASSPALPEGATAVAPLPRAVTGSGSTGGASAPARPSAPATPRENAVMPALEPRVESGTGAKAAGGASPRSSVELTGPLPRLRRDLRVTEVRKGLVEVETPETGRKFPIYDLEWRTAQLLDGIRGLREVRDELASRGLVVDASMVRAFVAELRGYGFLEKPGVMEETPSQVYRRTVGPSLGSDEERHLFDTAVQLVARADSQAAADYARALLEINPTNEAVRGMLAELERTMMPGDLARLDVDVAAGVTDLEPKTIAEEVKGSNKQRVALAGVGAALLLGAALFALWPRTQDDAVSSPPIAAAPAPQPTPVPAPPEAPTTPTAVPTAPAPTPAPEPVPEPTPPPNAAGSSYRLPIARRWHPNLVEVSAPGSGTLQRFQVEAGASVKKGQKIGAVLTAGGRSSSAEAAAVAEVAKLRALAEQDEEYQEFLAAAQAKLKKIQKGARRTTLSFVSPAAGVLAPTVSPGTEVSGAQRVAYITDGQLWLLAANLEHEIPRLDRMTCTIHNADGGTAACEIKGVELAAGVSQLVVSVRTKAAPWLTQVGTNYTLALEPASP